jgi:hypothetical protein
MSEKIPVYFDFLMANQAIAALETRAERLAETSPPGDRVVARAVADCVAAEFALRAAFKLIDREEELRKLAEFAEGDEDEDDIPEALMIYMAEGR